MDPHWQLVSLADGIWGEIRELKLGIGRSGPLLYASKKIWQISMRHLIARGSFVACPSELGLPKMEASAWMD